MPDFFWAHDDYRPTTVWKCPECDYEEKGLSEFPLAEAWRSLRYRLGATAHR